MSLTRRVFSAVAMTAALALGACGGSDEPRDETQTAYERGSDRGTGSADAPLTIIEYASVACPHCASFHEEVWPVLESEYIETGQVRFVFREMVTGSPQFAMAGFALAHCVAEDRYFEMIDLLFQQQRAIFQAARAPGGARGQYLAIARQMGLSEAEFNACLNNEEINANILAAHEQALDDGIDSTPRFMFNGDLLEARRAPGESEYTYFIGGQQLLIEGEAIPAIVDEETFRRMIDHLLAVDAAASEATE
jgi:protein-disulfide isomerase